MCTEDQKLLKTSQKTQSQLEALKALGSYMDFEQYKQRIVIMYEAAQHCDYFGENPEEQVINWHTFKELHNFFATLANLDDSDNNSPNLL